LTGPNRKQKRHKQNTQIGSNWLDVHQKAFIEIKQKLTSAPILGFPDFTHPFILETDASHMGLGAVLSQEQPEGRRVIAYASRGLRGGEKNPTGYSSKKLELLALVWAVTTKFRDYLEGGSFTVFTDNNPLTYVMKTEKLPALEQRWVGDLANFNFSIQYKSGKHNANADALSRQTCRPWDNRSQDEMESRISLMEIGTLIPDVLQEEVWIDVLEVEPVLDYPNPTVATSLSVFSQSDLKDLQQKDKNIKKILEFRRQGTKPSAYLRRQENKDVQLLLRQWKKLVELNEVLYRRIQDPVDGVINQLVLPDVLKEDILRGFHNQSGHQGRERTESLVRSRCYWPRMCNDIKTWIEQCDRCALAKKQCVKPPMGSLLASRPL
jgi:hypothetical protein